MQCRVNRILPLLLVSCIALASGCIFSPDKKPPKVTPPIEYEPPISPANVLMNLVKAYNGRDSVATKAVYNENYQGTSTDPSQPTPIVQFTRASEVSHVKNLHDNPDIVSVLLDLGQPGTWQVLPPNASDPPDWVIINTNFQRVEITDGSQQATYLSSNQQLEWAFKPDTTGSTTTWTVIRWTERTN